MMRKHFKKIVILSLFFLLVSGFGIKHAVSKGKKPKIPTTICMEIHGDITAGELDDSGNFIRPVCYDQTIMHNQTQLLAMPVDYDLTYFQGIEFKKPGDGAACFSKGRYYDKGLAVVKEHDGSASARVHFYAFVNDGATELHYILRMYGEFEGNWPPDNLGTTYIHLDSWEMESEGRGKLRKASCTRYGAFTPEFTTITVTRVDKVE